MPVYVLRSNTLNQIETFLAELFNLSEEDHQPKNIEDFIQQTQQAIDAVRNGERWVDLPAATPTIRRMQHDLAREAQLVSHSYGQEPHRRVRIYRE
jgi:predicted RNA-binding protein Jag